MPDREHAHSGAAATGHHPRAGDVGRRVAVRRERLGLSREEVAARAGMAPAYLEYLEDQPAEVSTGALIRLAGALRTTVAWLLGSGTESPPGPGRAARNPELVRLTPEECRDRLATRGVGRVALAGAEGPRVYPVNYAVVGDAVVYRTAAGSPLAADPGENVAFETDQLDEATSTGWSVLVTGPAEHITAPPSIEEATEPVPEPWAGGNRELWVRIRPDHVTGRRIRLA